MAQPAVIDNYVTSGLQEDHLSMGTSAALKLHKVLENVTQILAIEYLLAAQAFEFFKGPRFGVGTEARGDCCVSVFRPTTRTAGWRRTSPAA
jgi:histidine ammonia-lyase